MTSTETEQLVREAQELTGSAGPELLEEDAPVLREEPADGGGIYLVGLIGGKEVGKSALVNALAGGSITDETSHGPGTQAVVAYVHRSRQAELANLLQREVPGHYRIVPHEQAALGGQVLLDLPDIDSRFSAHLEITRRMLRHMLFPIWIQSVEKYADAQPQNLLAKVAAGNDPGNFLFCLNKADQLPPNGQGQELREDYARRLAAALALAAPPPVFMISARHPAQFDLPQLARLLSREKTPEMVAQGRERAGRRRQRTLLVWLKDLDLPARAARLARLEENAGEILAQRLGVPLLDQTVPAILDDPAYRLVMTDGVFAARVGRWPIVNLLHGLLTPLRLFIRQNTASAGGFGGAEALVDAHLSTGDQSMSRRVQSAFAQLHQSDPALAALYPRGKPWEAMQADLAETRLRRELVETVQRQRQIILSRLSGKSGLIAPLFRILLTVGALLWFPLVQPMLHAVLASQSILGSWRDVAVLLVGVFSGAALLQNAAFLLLWYLLIWAMLRWGTRRRVERLLSRWTRAKFADPTLNLATQALAWIDELLEPIHQARQDSRRLADQVEALGRELGEVSPGKPGAT